MSDDGFTVGEVAELVGVTVRTLHHWDRLGLATASGRSTGSYRLYSEPDIERVRRVVVYRELGLPLSEIADLLEANGDDATESLRAQRDQLSDHLKHLEGLRDDLDRMIAAHERGVLLTEQEQAEAFGKEWDPSWTEQAKQQWGDSPQWSQFAERSAKRSKHEWAATAERNTAAERELTNAYLSGATPQAVGDLVESHRQALSEYFPVTVSMHVCLGRTYVQDLRFRAHYEGLAKGFADWLHAAIDAAAAAQGLDPTTASWR